MQSCEPCCQVQSPYEREGLTLPFLTGTTIPEVIFSNQGWLKGLEGQGDFASLQKEAPTTQEVKEKKSHFNLGRM